jgi:hypothetical protein
MTQLATGTVIRYNKSVKPKAPILIVGLPGIGNVGKVVVEHLRREFKAKKFATLNSSHFPHQVMMLKSGGIRLVGNRFYIIPAKKPNTHDIILLTGDVQAVSPEGQYEVNSKIVNFFTNTLKGTFIYTIGGYSAGDTLVKDPKVFANATSKEVIAKFKDSGAIFGESRGMIWGSAGLIIAFAKMNKFDGICLMGETNLLDIDASAAKAVILVLAKRLQLDVDTTNLNKIIDQTAKALAELEKQAGSIGNAMQFPTGTEGKPGERPSYIR